MTMRVPLGERLRAFSNEALHLILLPTEACNFRCVYCYENFQYKRMEPAVVRGVRNWITHRAPGLRSIGISWFGGEPLLARDIIEDLMGHVQALAADIPAMRVSSDITTNGYLLTPAVLDKLLRLSVTGYQITFDGPRRWHDAKRVRHGGGGTFDRIWDNLRGMREARSPFTVTVRLHVDRENAEAMPEFIEQFERDFGGDERFELYVRPLSRLGGPNDHRLPVLDGGEGAQRVNSIRKLVEGRGLRQRRVRPQEAICYAARANSFVVRANGRLNKCTVALEHPDNQVGTLREDGTVQVHSDRMALWMRGLNGGSPEELKCPMHGLADSLREKGGTATPGAAASP